MARPLDVQFLYLIGYDLLSKSVKWFAILSAL